MQEWISNMGFWWYIIFFFIIQLINVSLNTLKTIITARAKKFPAAVINAVTYGFYTLVLALTADISNLWINMAVTIVANIVSVYFSIAVLDRLRKDRLWEITATVQENDKILNVGKRLNESNISYNISKTQREHEAVYHIYSKSQKESKIIKQILVDNKAKYIVHEENKIL